MIRALRRAASITRLLDTLISALPAVSNVFLLLALTIYIYALLGMSLFGELEFESGPYKALNAHANFRTFHVAFLTLFRFSTGESWNALMHDCMDQTTGWAFVYFTTFQLICGYLILNLVVAIVINRFQKVTVRPYRPYELPKNTWLTFGVGDFVRGFSSYSTFSWNIQDCMGDL